MYFQEQLYKVRGPVGGVGCCRGAGLRGGGGGGVTEIERNPPIWEFPFPPKVGFKNKSTFGFPTS